MVQEACVVATGSCRSGVRGMKWRVLEQRRNFPHVERKIYHMVNGLMCFALYAFVLTDAQALWVLSIVGGAWLAVDALRFRSVAVNNAALRIFGGLMRREELRSLTGNSYFILGLVLVLSVFPRPIVCLSALYLALGDPIAALVGTRWGRIRLFGKKSLEGALANFVVTAAATALCGSLLFSTSSVWALAVVGGACSAVSELIPVPIDDNFTIPVFSASLLWFASQCLPIFAAY